MIPFPEVYDSELQPLVAEQISAAGQRSLAALKSQGYEVRSGLTPKFADAIAVMAREPSIREYCPNDSGKRFADNQATLQWLGGGRAVYLLLYIAENTDPELAGYGWVGAKQNPLIPGGQTTFSLRLGEAHQGKGLATPFAISMLAAADSVYHTPHMWLETWASNGGAVHIYQKLGFIVVAEKNDQRLTVSGERVADTRLFMALASDIQATKKTAT